MKTSYPPAYDESKQSCDSSRLQEFQRVVNKWEITQFFASRIRQLEGYEIVVIVDDSGSMSCRTNEPTPDAPFANFPTRWDELKSSITIIMEIATLMDPSIEIFFLNRGVVRNVSSLSAVESAFAAPPEGYTPTAACFQAVLQEKASVVTEKKLLIICLTDGQPTTSSGQDDRSSLFNVLLNRKPVDRIFVTFVACTDDAQTMNYLQSWDEQIPNLDVCDDYQSERLEILKVQGSNFSFTKGDYIVKILLGAIDQALDQLDEVKLTPGQIAGTRPIPTRIKRQQTCCSIC